jgi:hypothetical protein
VTSLCKSIRAWTPLIALALAATTSPTRAQVASDQPAAILVFPKIVVNVTENGERTDTLIRISNVSPDRPISLHCFYVNANGHCRSQPSTICDPYTLGAENPCDPFDPCIAGWQETNFVVNVTARQPVSWLASRGAALCDQSPQPDLPCFPLTTARPGFQGQDNLESRVPPVPENPFIGYLRCIAVDRNEVPVERNDLIGVAEITTFEFDEARDAEFYDVRSYNAVGIAAIQDRNDGDKTLVIGGGGCVGGERTDLPCEGDHDCPGGTCRLAEYEGCPNVLILDHFFDGANDPVAEDPVYTKITLVPCSDDLERQAVTTTPVQFLVFNEFEQRFSTSWRVTCFQEWRLTDIDRSSEVRSIFSAAVGGTLTGQTRLRGVVGNDPRFGYTFLGIAEEFRRSGDGEASTGSAAFNMHFHGSRPQSDFIHLP